MIPRPAATSASNSSAGKLVKTLHKLHPEISLAEATALGEVIQADPSLLALSPDEAVRSVFDDGFLRELPSKLQRLLEGDWQGRWKKAEPLLHHPPWVGNDDFSPRMPGGLVPRPALASRPPSASLRRPGCWPRLVTGRDWKT
jgi:hypothetical protein